MGPNVLSKPDKICVDFKILRVKDVMFKASDLEEQNMKLFFQIL